MKIKQLGSLNIDNDISNDVMHYGTEFYFKDGISDYGYLLNIKDGYVNAAYDTKFITDVENLHNLGYKYYE